MRFYDREHRFYCGIDLHASWMYLCIQDDRGTILLHRNLPTCSEAFQAAVQPYRQDLAVAVECMFSWYWIADLCAQMNITFVLGHALYMKAIHGGKTKNDKIDSKKIASLLRAKMLPVAYPYPQATRSTRDLLRRRMYFMHHQSELLTHIQNTNTQYNLPGFSKRIDRHSNRVGLPELFPDPMVRKSIEADVVLLDVYHAILLKLERQVLQQARHHDPVVLGLLRTVPGIGKILALVMIYEIHDIRVSPPSVTSSPTAAWSNPHASRPARNRAPRTPRSATSTSSGLSVRLPVCSSEPTAQPKSSTSGWSANTASPKPSRSSPRSLDAPSTASSSTGSPSIPRSSLVPR
jgi:transposase